MILLLFLITLDPKFTGFLLVCNDLSKTLDSVVKLSLGELECLLNTNLCGFQSGLNVHQFILSLVKFFDLALSFV